MGLAIGIIFRLLEVFELILLIRCVMSFFASPYNKFYEFLLKVTEPVLSPIREVLMKTGIGMSGFDFSPIVAILLIGVIERCLSLISNIF